MARVSQKSIAQAVGVHVSTVSLALRNSPKIPKSTRAKIQAMAKKLGYTEDPFLSALCRYRESQKRRSHVLTLGFISDWQLPLTEICHHRHFLWGTRKRAADLGFHLDEFNLHDQQLSSRRLQEILHARNIEGLILSSFAKGRLNLELDWGEFSAVRIGCQPENPALHSIAVNHQQTLMTAIQKTREYGYRRPGLVMGRDWPRLVNYDWEIAYGWEQQKLPLAQRIPPFLYEHEAVEAHCAGVEDWYAAYRPDVILAPNAIYAEICTRTGRKAPDEIGFVDCFLDQPDSRYAGVVHACGAIGQLAVDFLSGMLINHRHGVPDQPTNTLIDSAWQDGPTLVPR